MLEPATPKADEPGRLTTTSPLQPGWPCRWCAHPLSFVLNHQAGTAAGGARLLPLRQPRRSTPVSVYAYLCIKCPHLSSNHRLVPAGDLRAGPYRCLRCNCERPQDGPDKPLTKRQYEALPDEIRMSVDPA